MKLNVSSRGLDRLRALSDALKNTSPMLERLGANLAEEARDLVIQGFQKQSDPYGDPWAPKKHPDGRAILTGKTGNLRRSWNRKPVKIGKYKWRVATDRPYARHLQKGTKNRDGSIRMVARKMVPDDRGFPPDWREALRETAVEYMRDHFRGVGIRAQKKAHFR